MTQEQIVSAVLWELITGCMTLTSLDKIGEIIKKQDLPEPVKQNLRVSWTTKRRNLLSIEGIKE